MIHELKCNTKYFNDLKSNKKRFEVRKNDRDFKERDFIALNEYEDGNYKGRSMIFRIDYILDDPEYVKEGYVILSIKPCGIQPGAVRTEVWEN